MNSTFTGQCLARFPYDRHSGGKGGVLGAVSVHGINPLIVPCA
ncbi:MAG: hypothetical protein Q7J98_11525 [Kiritimatiellia bacterium]|nr:hypothetical protein [Kiritimatiellia bacterium]